MASDRNRTRRCWEFPARERRAVLLLLPLLGALVWLVSETLRPRFGDSAPLLGDTLAERGETPGRWCRYGWSAQAPIVPFRPQYRNV